MSLKSARILIIDATEEWRGILLRSLSDLECQIDTAKTPEEAITKLENEQFNLVILDIRLETNKKNSYSLAAGLVLLTEIGKKNVDTVVVSETKTSASECMDSVELVISVLTSFNVKDFIIKNKFNPKNYQEKIEKILKIKNPHYRELKYNLPYKDVQLLQTKFANLQSWRLGEPRERAAILIAAGIPENFVDVKDLSSSHIIAATIIINQLNKEGYMMDPPEYTPLGLLVKLLYENSHDVEGQTFCARLLLEHQLTKDEVFLQELRKHFLPTSSNPI